jgi:hypothetical protein
MAEGTLQNRMQKSGGGICGRSGKTNPRLVRMGPSFYRKPQNPSPKPAHSWIPEPTDTSESLFDQDFDQFMNSLDNFEPFDDLEDWSDNIDLFMDAMAHPPQNADALWELAKLKKGKSKAPKQSSKLIFGRPWIKEPEGLTPTQSWLYWMNENALRVEMGIPLLAHPKHTYSKIGGLTDSDSEYSSNSEDELDDLIQYSKKVKSNSTKNTKSDQDSLTNLVIYATPQGRTVRLKETQDSNAFNSRPSDLPFQQSIPLHLSSSKQEQKIQDLCREILMVRIS